MHGRILKALFLALAALALAAHLALAGEPLGAQASTSPPAHSSATAPIPGINIGGPRGDTTPAEIQGAISAASALHARIVRVEISWSQLQPLAAGETNGGALASTDRVVQDAAAAGLQVLMVMDSTPCWASSAPAALLARCSPSRAGKANSWPPRNPADFASFAASLAARYGNRLGAIEVWNEPDYVGEAYFAGPNKAQRYVALVRAAYTAIKQADPEVPVLAGSLVGSNGVFLRALYASGMKGFYDGLAVHFYSLTLAGIRSIHSVQLANGDLSPLWLDEFGWSSCWPHARIEDEQGCTTAAAQAANLADVVRSLSSANYVHAVVPFKLDDSPHEAFGVLSESGGRKPSFGALASAFALPFAKPHAVSLRLRRRGGQLVAAGTGPAGDFLQLEVSRHGVLRYRAVFTLDRFDRYSIRLPRVLGSRGLHVRAFQLWAGPHSAVQKNI